MSELITEELVDLGLVAGTRESVTRALAERMAGAGRVTDLEGFLADVAAREAQMPTGMEGGIGIPHCRSAHVTEATLAFGRLAEGVDFGALDGRPADLIFLIGAPAGADEDHLTILAALARRLAAPGFAEALREAESPAVVAALLRGEQPPPSAAGVSGASGGDVGASGGGGAGGGGGDTAGAAGRADDGAAGLGDDGAAESEDQADDDAGAGHDADADAGGEQTTAAAPAAFRIVAVTSCPTGIAHTYMAAESLERAGREAGVDLVVETQGSGGFSRLDPAVIAAADGVVFAHDVEVRERERFAGKPTVDVGVKAAISRPAELIAAVREKARRGETTTAAAGPADQPETATPAPATRGEGFGSRLRRYLMSGVSYMVPFVAAGGLLIALSFALGGYDITDAPSVGEHFLWLEKDSWAALLFQIGAAAFAFLIPVLAGYIAYGMADRPGLVPGFVGGAIATTIEAGFLGGLVAGLVAGSVVMAIQRLRVPASLRGIMPVLVIPLLGSLTVGFLMYVVIGKPIAEFQNALSGWLEDLSGTNAVLLGMVLGLMMCFDLGGPVNKIAYAFAVGGLADPSTGSLKVMAAVMAAGMVPPLAMALATTVRARLFTRTEQENGKAAWVLGASFISEGAIPFAAADPLRVLPSVMAGGAVTGALSMAFGSTLRAPHGGVFVVALVGAPLLYLLAIAVGTVVSAALVILLKRGRPPVPASPAAGTPAEAAEPPSVLTAARRLTTPRARPKTS